MIQIPDYRKVLPVVYGILDFGIGNSAQGIRKPTNDWNPERVRNPGPEIPWNTLWSKIELMVFGNKRT